MKKLATLFFFYSLVFHSVEGRAQPQPGDVYRDFVYIPPGEMQDAAELYFSELDPACTRDFSKSHTWAKNKARMVKKMVGVDLQNAIRAELSVEYWGGHIGTSQQKLSVNDHDWLPLPQPLNTPLAPECYHRTLLGNNAVSIPLDWLVQGENNVRFHAGSQKCYDFDFGFYWIYSFTIRVYYELQSRPAKIAGIVPGATLSDTTRIHLVADNSKDIKRVDYFGYYRDFNWSGDGQFTQWQYNTFYGDMRHHIGTSKSEPFDVHWDCSWLPDQTDIKIAAKVTLNNDLTYITDSIDELRLMRKDRTVTLFTPIHVPTRFSARAGGSTSCFIDIDNLDKTTAAKLVLSTWSGATDDLTPHQILLNGQLLADNFGVFHNYAFNELDIPVERLKLGENVVTVYSEYLGHALEINWPGPVLKIKYAK